MPMQMDTAGLSNAGLWVRRMRHVPSLADEAICLAQVLQTWALDESMNIDDVSSAHAEVSSPNLQPTWIYLIEINGTRTNGPELPPNHPLSQVAPGEQVRLLALVQPPDYLIPGVLVEANDQRRMLWVRTGPPTQ